MGDSVDLVIDKIGDPVQVNFPEFRFRCPFCVDNAGKADWSGHLYVNPEKGYFCHRCEARGSFSWLLKQLGVTAEELQGQTPEYHDLIRQAWEASRKALSRPEQGFQGVEPVELPENVYEVWEVPEVLNYALNRRGLRPFDFHYYGLKAWIDQRGHPRLLFPDYTDDVLVYWTARAIYDHCEPKYMSASNSEKSMCVWNLNRVRPDRPIYVAEGIMSARACGTNGVAIYGKYLSEVQAAMLARRSSEHGVRIVLDAGKDSWDKARMRKRVLAAVERLLRLNTPCGMVLLPGDGTDPDDMPREQLQELLLRSQPMTLDDISRVRAEAL